jgi:hypothetical protein
MGLSTIYLVCAVAGGTVLLLRMILMVTGLGHMDTAPDVTTEVNFDHDGAVDSGDGHGGAYTFLSIQSISGFFTMFGLVGLGLLQINASDFWSLAGALAAGVFTAWCTGMIFIGMQRLQSDGTLKIENAIGKHATVYLTIPETGTGSINISIQGSLRTMDAMSDNGQRIPTGSIVKVLRVTAGNILVVSAQSE